MLRRSEVVINLEAAGEEDLRISAAMDAIKRAVPAVRMDHAILSNKNRWQRIDDGAELLRQRLRLPRGQDTVVLGNGRKDEQMLTLTLGRVAGTKGPSPSKVWAYRIAVANENPDTTRTVVALLRELCVSLVPFSGWASTYTSLGQLSRSREEVEKGVSCVGPGGKEFSMPRTLKPGENVYEFSKRKLVCETASGIQVDIPICWIQYWSDRVANRLGFPFPGDAHPDLLERLGSGWLFRLTQEPLDLDKPDHLQRLRWIGSAAA